MGSFYCIIIRKYLFIRYLRNILNLRMMGHSIQWGDLHTLAYTTGKLKLPTMYIVDPNEVKRFQ